MLDHIEPAGAHLLSKCLQPANTLILTTTAIALVTPVPTAAVASGKHLMRPLERPPRRIEEELHKDGRKQGRFLASGPKSSLVDGLEPTSQGLVSPLSAPAPPLPAPAPDPPSVPPPPSLLPPILLHPPVPPFLLPPPPAIHAVDTVIIVRP